MLFYSILREGCKTKTLKIFLVATAAAIILVLPANAQTLGGGHGGGHIGGGGHGGVYRGGGYHGYGPLYLGFGLGFAAGYPWYSFPSPYYPYYDYYPYPDYYSYSTDSLNPNNPVNETCYAFVETGYHLENRLDPETGKSITVKVLEGNTRAFPCQ